LKALVLGFDTEYDYLGLTEGWSKERNVAFGLEALEVIVNHLKEFDAPATFFLVGEYVQQAPQKFASLIGNGAHEIGNHSHTHIQMKDYAWHRSGKSVEDIRSNLRACNRVLAEAFGVSEIPGLCVPGGYYKGMQDRPDLVEMFVEEGFAYISSDSRGPQETIPAPLSNQPYWYQCGSHRLLEVPHNGWHCNVISGLMSQPTWWPPLPDAIIPSKKVETVDEQLDVYRREFEYGLEHNLFYAPVFHPWSIYRFDPKIVVIGFLLNEARQHSVPVIRYGDVRGRIAGEDR